MGFWGALGVPWIFYWGNGHVSTAASRARKNQMDNQMRQQTENHVETGVVCSFRACVLAVSRERKKGKGHGNYPIVQVRQGLV